MGQLTDKSPDYRPDSKTADDIRTLVDRLRHRPEVEAVSLSQNSYPYNGSNSSDPVEYDTLRTNSYVVRRLVTPDFVRVFRYRGVPTGACRARRPTNWPRCCAGATSWRRITSSAATASG